MKYRLFIRTIIIASVALLCTGMGVYSFFSLDAAEKQQEFNLYTLVPQDAIAVFETDRMADLVEDINRMQCSKDNHFLCISEIFTSLKTYLYTLMDDTPHGLSRQMNKVLISFHEPDTPQNQVLYCSLGKGDPERVETFIKKYFSGTFPAKQFDYEGEEIRIYPVAGGRFLAVYYTSDFLIISFQKRLVEKVIDAYRKKESLMETATFSSMYAARPPRIPATVFIRMKAIGMGKAESDTQSSATLGSWAAFDIKLGEEAIYCSGTSYDSDSLPTFINALRKQEPIEGFPGEQLPGTTFFYNTWAVSDRKEIFDFTSTREYAKTAYSDYIKQRDSEWLKFLDEEAEGRIMSCLFLPKDTTEKLPCAVMGVPLKDAVQAERRLQQLIAATPAEKNAPKTVPSPSLYTSYSKARKYKQYVLPRNTLLTQITGITQSALHPYAAFYRGVLLLAPDAHSLSTYIDALEEDNLLEGKLFYEEGVASLSQTYSFAMMADMETMSRLPDSYVRLVPNFFFRQSDFFRHFILYIQFINSEGVIYPNIVLLYKEEPKEETGVFEGMLNGFGQDF